MLAMQRDTENQIYTHAMEEFPNECCGAILTDGVQEFVRRCKNIQNERHADDPETYPRDARTAYLMDPNDLIKIHREVDTEGRQIKAFTIHTQMKMLIFPRKIKPTRLSHGGYRTTLTLRMS